MKKSVAITVISILSVVAIALGVLYYTNNVSKSKEISLLNSDVADKATKIETLTSDVADKASQIDTLNADVADKAGQIETLTADVTDKAKQIETLTADVTDKAGQIETLNTDVVDKADQIKQLTADVAQRDTQIKTLNDDIAEKGSQNESLTADVTDKAGQIETLTSDVKDKGEQIEALTADTTEKAEQIKKLTADGAQKDSKIETLTADVEEKGSQIEALTNDVVDKTGQIETLTATVSEKEEKITTLSAKVAEQEKKLNYSSMSEEELLSVVDSITPPLEKLGYSVMARNYANSNIESGNSVEEAFVSDLVKGLEDRWEISTKYDTTTMTDKQVIDYYSSLVMCELDYLSKYTEIEFSDKSLEEYAHGYISALQNQYIAITEFYGVDDAQYNEYWNDAYYSRAQMLYWINRKYGLNVSSKNKATLTEFVETGSYVDQYKAIDKSITAQLENHELGLMNSDEWHVNTKPFSIKNNTAYFIESLTIYLNLYDESNELLSKEYLYSGSGIAAGKEIKIDSDYISTKFDHADYEFEFNVSGTVSGNNYYEQHKGSANSSTRIGWNGRILNSGTVASGQPIYTVEDLEATWEANKSWSKTLYVPALKFSVKNTGDADGEKVTVHVVFTNNEKNEVWDEETNYVIGSSDSPLKPGYSKKTFVYSSVGYESIPTIVPSITAEVFINGELVKTVDVVK